MSTILQQQYEQTLRENERLRAALTAFVVAAERGATTFFNLRGSCLRQAYEALGKSSGVRLRSARQVADEQGTPVAKP